MINDNFRTFPAHNSPHCARCGEATTVQCPSCKAEIRGSYEVDGVVGFSGGYEPPAFCYKCGKPYPWTERRLRAAKELADEFEELSQEEREKLKGSLDDLVRDGPNIEVASTRFKKIMKKLGAGSVEAMKNIVTEVASEAAKRSLFGI